MPSPDELLVNNVMHDSDPSAAWYEIMTTTSMNREVHNVSKHRQRRIAATGNRHKNAVMLGRAVFELRERTDKQTNRHTHR